MSPPLELGLWDHFVRTVAMLLCGSRGEVRTEQAAPAGSSRDTGSGGRWPLHQTPKTEATVLALTGGYRSVPP